MGQWRGFTLLLHGSPPKTTKEGLHQVHGEGQAWAGQQCSAFLGSHEHLQTYRPGAPLHHFLLSVWWHHLSFRASCQKLRYVQFSDIYIFISLSKTNNFWENYFYHTQISAFLNTSTCVLHCKMCFLQSFNSLELKLDLWMILMLKSYFPFFRNHWWQILGEVKNQEAQPATLQHRYVPVLSVKWPVCGCLCQL